MWDLQNRTRFVADRTFARDRDGAEVLLVAVKATFSVGHDHPLRLAPEQVPLRRAPRHLGEPDRSSLLYESDFALAKRATDILLVGHARARDEKPTIAAEVRVRVGDWQKRVVVFGDRRWTQGISGVRLTEPERFTSIPLVYERAFGGPDNRHNPVGVGAPNIEDPDDLITAPHQDKRPVSFGPIARDWRSRRDLAGTYDERWRRERRPLVPADFDDAFWQCAPTDQRASIQGGESVELSGVSAAGPLRFELPRLEFSFRSRVAGKVVEHTSSLHTVQFEPDEGRVVLVYQSSLFCHYDIRALERTIVEEVGPT